MRQYRVTIDPNKLRSYGVKLSEVEEAVKSGNENASGGFISTGPTEYTVRGIGRFDSVEGIRDTVVAERNGVPLFLRDVAEVSDGTAIRRGIATKNGKEVIVTLVIKQPSADTVAVVEGIEEAIEDMRATLPAGVRLTQHYNQTHLIQESLSSVTRAILVGAVLVILVLLAFLGHLRSTLIVAVSLPLSVLMAGVLMRQLGVGLNTMSLGGLAIAVGIMVDASIIMVENIYHRFHRSRSSLADWIKSGYVPALEYALGRRWAVIGLALGLLVPTALGLMAVGKDFMPKLDEGQWFVQTVTPPETSLEENDRITGQVEQLFADDPNVINVVRRNGRSERAIGCVLPVNSGEMIVSLKPKHKLLKPADELMAEMRDRIDHIPGVAVAFTQPLQNKIDESMEGTPAPLQVKLFGPDIQVLAQTGREIEDIVRGTRGVADVKMDQAVGIPQVQVQIDRQAAARYGVSVASISEVVRLAIGGEELTQVWKNQRSYGVFVRFPDQMRGDIESIKNLMVDTPSGGPVPLSQVAEVTLSEGPNVIWREAMNRRVSIDASIQGRDLGGRRIRHQEGDARGKAACRLLRGLRRSVPEPAESHAIIGPRNRRSACGGVHAPVPGAAVGLARRYHPGDRPERVHRGCCVSSDCWRKPERLISRRLHRALRNSHSEQPRAADTDRRLHRRGPH